MGSLLPRGGKLYAKIKAVDGSWQRVATGFDVTQRTAAEKWLAEKEAQVAAHRAALAARGVAAMTVARYADEWLKRRKTATVADDRTRITRHVLPRLGPMLLADVRPRHIRDLVLALRNAGELAPATIRQISGVLHTMFKSAVIEELITANPIELDRGVLPKKVDKDPTWRHQAIYTRGEIEALISDERILVDRRVLYALKALAALRHTEAATLTWAQYDAIAQPLGALNLGKTKSGVPRRMPVHPTLAKILAAWKLSGWRELYGRNPKTEDLIVPTRNLNAREAAEAQKQLVADLKLLGLRVKAGEKLNRRGHDMRRTFITLARTDGAQKDILRWVTHGPSSTDMMDVYASFDWPTLCGEVAKLKLELLEGKVIELPRAAAAGDDRGVIASDPHDARGPAVVQPKKAERSPADKWRPQRDSNPCYLRERRVS